jgi:predicted MFS family arabinose efflux permease
MEICSILKTDHSLYGVIFATLIGINIYFSRAENKFNQYSQFFFRFVGALLIAMGGAAIIGEITNSMNIFKLERAFIVIFALFFIFLFILFKKIIQLIDNKVFALGLSALIVGISGWTLYCWIENLGK